MKISEFGQEDLNNGQAGNHQTDRSSFLVDDRSGDFDVAAFVDSLMPTAGVHYVDYDPVTTPFDSIDWGNNLARKYVRTIVWGPPGTTPTLEEVGISAP